MIMKKIFEVDVNRLTEILSRYFKEKIVIESVYVASSENQHNLENKGVGISGVLTLVCSTKGKENRYERGRYIWKKQLS